MRPSHGELSVPRLMRQDNRKGWIMSQSFKCEPFPNTMVFASARKIGRGAKAGSYRAIVRTVERSAWTAPCVSTFKSFAAFVNRCDALEIAADAAREAAATGYVPGHMAKPWEQVP